MKHICQTCDLNFATKAILNHHFKTCKVGYGKPVILKRPEYEDYHIYLHFSEKMTSYLRDTLDAIGPEYDNIAYFRLHEDRLEIGIPNYETDKVMEVYITKDEFVVFHSCVDTYLNPSELLPFDIDMMRMRLGGGQNGKRPIFAALEKKEIRLIVTGGYDIDFG